MSESDSFRVGHSDRDQAKSDLRRAHAEGRLSDDELDERLERAGAAVTVGDINSLFIDLPRSSTDLVTAPGAMAAPLGAGGHREPGYSLGDPLNLSAPMTAEKRGGSWVVPPFIRAHAILERVVLDCLLARAAAEVIDLEVIPGAEKVLLILPEGWAVDTSRLSSGLGGTVKSTVAREPSWGSPLIVVRGSVGLGVFKARHANRWDKRRNKLDR